MLSDLRPVPICSALRFLVAGLPPAFIYRRISRLSQGTAYPSRATLMVRPLLSAEPGPGDAPCTTWALSVFLYPLYLQAGRPSGRPVLRSNSVFRPPPSFLRLQPFSWRVSCNGKIGRASLGKECRSRWSPYH